MSSSWIQANFISVPFDSWYRAVCKKSHIVSKHQYLAKNELLQCSEDTLEIHSVTNEGNVASRFWREWVEKPGWVFWIRVSWNAVEHNLKNSIRIRKKNPIMTNQWTLKTMWIVERKHEIPFNPRLVKLPALPWSSLGLWTLHWYKPRSLCLVYTKRREPGKQEIHYV